MAAAVGVVEVNKPSRSYVPLPNPDVKEVPLTSVAALKKSLSLFATMILTPDALDNLTAPVSFVSARISPIAALLIAVTIAAASRIIKEKGVKSLSVVATHGIFSDGSIEELKDAPIDNIIVTDTLTQNGNSKEIGNVETLSVSTIIANALTSIFTDDSVSALFLSLIHI